MFSASLTVNTVSTVLPNGAGVARVGAAAP